jgi:hypothetical protein
MASSSEVGISSISELYSVINSANGREPRLPGVNGMNAVFLSIALSCQAEELVNNFAADRYLSRESC